MNFLETPLSFFTRNIAAIAVWALFLVVLAAINAILGRRIKRAERQAKETSASQTLIKVSQRIVIPLLFLLSLSLFVENVTFPDTVQRFIGTVVSIIVALIIIRTANKLVELFFSKYLEREGGIHERTLKPLISFIRLFIWALGLLLLLSNLGFNITTALAGLGIGGIAVAFAAQKILGDLFSYFVIFFDHPFALGDYIVFEDKNGVVERIGIKSTHLRTLGGEILVISNSDLTNSRIHNYKQMERRRIVFSLHLPFHTEQAKLQRIPTLIKEAVDGVETIEGVLLDRSHLQSIGSSAFVFETVYYVPSGNYAIYMDVQQEIYLAIIASFRAEGIEFAYPTQRLVAEEKAPIIVQS